MNSGRTFQKKYQLVQSPKGEKDHGLYQGLDYKWHEQER